MKCELPNLVSFNKTQGFREEKEKLFLLWPSFISKTLNSVVLNRTRVTRFYKSACRDLNMVTLHITQCST